MEVEWEIIDPEEKYKNVKIGWDYCGWSKYNPKYVILHNCKETNFGRFGYANRNKECYKCKKEVPNYILFQWRLLNS